MLVMIASIVAAVVISVAIERLTVPPSPWLAGSVPTLLIRIAIYLYLFGFFFAWSGRPWASAWAVVWVVAGFAAVSRGKFAFIREPLVFSDLAFLGDVFRHPKLFYTSLLGPLVFVALLGSVGLSVYVCFKIEPHWLPAGHELTALFLAAAAWGGITALPFLPMTRRRLERMALAVKPDADIFSDVARDGCFTTLLLDWLCWRGDDRSERVRNWQSPGQRMAGLEVAADAADLIVVAQCESFLDFRRLGSQTLQLPAIDAARSRAVAWGPLVNACPGGYTLRSEFSFLIGEANSRLAFDRYYPYLNAGPYGARALPNLLKPFGFRSTYLHPYHPEFFNRDRALPELGFDRLVMLDRFDGAEQVGDYVSDKALADRVIAEARASTGRALLFSATMENHGPWVPGRFPGLSDPVAIFEQHLRNGDAMLGRLIEHFDTWPGRVVLVFYGDHVPLLKAFAHPFPDARTDYLLLELGAKARPRAGVGAKQLETHQLTWQVLALAGVALGSRADAPSSVTKV